MNDGSFVIQTVSGTRRTILETREELLSVLEAMDERTRRSMRVTGDLPYLGRRFDDGERVYAWLKSEETS